ncbi:MAG: alternative ribosome rescue aminoacyl-tRNA hydrolase ArfB [Pseudomonadota bacterium]|nr:alternative ribosome rescue aminoacyl-tRNA hydrolase ArfB [Pseudomonadota bacterium]
MRISPSELEEHFIRASGPGGQNVNKVASAVELRFDAARSPNLPEDVRTRLMRLAGSRLTNDGVIVIRAERFRTQERNRADARDRLLRLIARAAEPRKPRIPTKPGKAAKDRRIKSKKQRGRTKTLRRAPPRD